MKFSVNIWTKLLSHLVKIPVDQMSSLSDESLYVDLVKGRLQLSTDTAVYSFDDKYDNFVAAFKAADISSFAGKSFLVLGGGLGSVPYIVEKKHGIYPHFTLVEFDLSVVRLFARYTRPRLKSEVDIVSMDALEYMKRNMNKFDVIVIDLFIHDTIPDQFLEPSFLEMCKKALHPSGMILFNWMTVSRLQLTYYNDYRTLIFNRIMPETKEVKTKYNHVLIGTLGVANKF